MRDSEKSIGKEPSDAVVISSSGLLSAPETNRGGTDLTVAGDRLYFSAYDPQSGTELWALAPE